MKPYFWLVLTALSLSQALMSAPIGHAQAQQQSSINLTMEHRHTIKELLLNDRAIARQKLPALEKGSILPQEVELRPLPTAIGDKIPNIKNHSYVMSDRLLALVDTQERKVVEIIGD